MSEKKAEFTFEDFRNVIEQLAPSMNDYLYVYDIPNDQYYISPRAVERFAVPKCQFTDVTNTLGLFVHPEDFPSLQEDLGRVISGEKASHDITYRWLGKDGHSIWINCKGRSILGSDGKPQFLVGCVNEVGIKPIADNVSGLLESVVIKDSLDRIHANSPDGFVLRIGIDDFKSINEKIGIEFGDYILSGVAELIVQTLAEGQKVYRVVADEFMVVDYHGGTAEEAKELYDRVRSLIDSYIAKMNYKTFFTISAGVITGADMEKMDYNEIMKISQFALSEAKNRGKNQVYRFDIADYQKFLRKRELLVAMRKAVSNDYEGFDVFFQPIMKVGVEELYAAESLLRFKTSEGESVSPVEFIPILEESGLIIPVGKWVLHRALSMCRECQQTQPDFKISVNLSYVQILKSNIFEEIVNALEEHGLKQDSLIVEMTESGYVDTTPVVKRVWQRLRKHGVLIAIDDFGTGYSNFQSISTMMPNIVKLDRGFTVKALENFYEHQLMNHIIQLVHSVDLKICVEGVETMDELTEIEKLSADCIQGYYYGRPCEKSEFFDKFIN